MAIQIQQSANRAERNARWFLLAAPAGALSFVFVLAAMFLDPNKTGFARGNLVQLGLYISAIGMVGSLVVLFLCRKADEYTHSLWYTAVSIGFAVGVVLGLFGSLVEYAIWRVFYGISEVPDDGKLVSDSSGLAMILVFYGTIVFEHIRRSRHA